MTFKSINCFNDGKLDVDELNKIVDIALNGVVDDNEKRVLSSISRLSLAECRVK